MSNNTKKLINRIIMVLTCCMILFSLSCVYGQGTIDPNSITKPPKNNILYKSFVNSCVLSVVIGDVCFSPSLIKLEPPSIIPLTLWSPVANTILDEEKILKKSNIIKIIFFKILFFISSPPIINILHCFKLFKWLKIIHL